MQICVLLSNQTAVICFVHQMAPKESVRPAAEVRRILRASISTTEEEKWPEWYNHRYNIRILCYNILIIYVYVNYVYG